jgi:hypothetical protein
MHYDIDARRFFESFSWTAGWRLDFLYKGPQFLAGFEKRDSFGRHFDASARFGIPSNPCLSLSSPKTAEAADFDFVPAIDGAHHAVKNALHDDPCFVPRNLCHAGNFLDQFRFREGGTLGSGGLPIPIWKHA